MLSWGLQHPNTSLLVRWSQVEPGVQVGGGGALRMGSAPVRGRFTCLRAVERGAGGTSGRREEKEEEEGDKGGREEGKGRERGEGLALQVKPGCRCGNKFLCWQQCLECAGTEEGGRGDW